MSKDRARRGVRGFLILFVLAVSLLVTPTSSMGNYDREECLQDCQIAYDECLSQCPWCSLGYRVWCYQQYQACYQACPPQ